MFLKKEEFFNRINDIVGNDTSDEAISFFEDMQDTYNGLEKKIEENSGADWKAKYDEDMAALKEKYRRRFFSSTGSYVEDEQDKKEFEREQRAKNITIDDLLKGE